MIPAAQHPEDHPDESKNQRKRDKPGTVGNQRSFTAPDNPGGAECPGQTCKRSDASRPLHLGNGKEKPRFREIYPIAQVKCRSHPRQKLRHHQIKCEEKHQKRHIAVRLNMRDAKKTHDGIS